MSNNFVLLKHGDVLAAVSVAQLLLKRTGATISADGIFGQKTMAAVKDFQRSHSGLGVDGIIGKDTWTRLKHTETLPIIDFIDVFDPDLYSSERRFLHLAGTSPITIGGMSNGIEQAVTNLLSSSLNVFLVRFHGHGAPGAAGVSDGHGDISSRSTFENNPETMAAMRRLKPLFGKYGCVQFMHCQTGRGAIGRTFLQKISSTLNVPVTAAVNDQYGSTLSETLRFEGRTATSCPGGNLKSWSSSRIQFPGMSFQ